MPDEQKLPSGPCLEPEVLAAYVERTLTPDERARVEAHLAECGDCDALMTEVLRTIDDMDGRVESEPQESGVPSVAESSNIVRPAVGRRRSWRVAGGLLATAAAILLLVRFQPDWFFGVFTARDARLASLISAVGNERLTEARLTGPFPYAPAKSVTRSGEPSTDNLSLLAAAGELQKLAASDPSGSSLHAFGVAQLLLGQHDRAIATLERAADADPADPRIRSDLAAAYFTRAQARRDTADLPRALDSVERALQLLPSTHEALFNKARILEALGLATESIAAWQEYLRIDSASPWAAEAREHLSILAKPSASVPELRGQLAAVTEAELPLLVSTGSSDGSRVR